VRRCLADDKSDGKEVQTGDGGRTQAASEKTWASVVGPAKSRRWGGEGRAVNATCEKGEKKVRNQYSLTERDERKKQGFGRTGRPGKGASNGELTDDRGAALSETVRQRARADAVRSKPRRTREGKNFEHPREPTRRDRQLSQPAR
jgi:hypothetical protein